MRRNPNRSPLFLLVLILTLFLHRNTVAQTILLDPAEIYIGTTHGVTGSRILFNPSVQQTYLLGYTGGLSFRYVTEKHFGVQVEANYSQRGWTEQDGYSRQLNYIEVPFLTHYYLGDTHRFIINLGPKLGYLLNESTLANSTVEPAEDQQTMPAHFKFDYGIAAGLGYNLYTRKAGIFQLELRFYYGLSDVFPNSKSDFFNMSNHLNAGLTVGWYLQLTGKKKTIETEKTELKAQ